MNIERVVKQAKPDQMGLASQSIALLKMLRVKVMVYLFRSKHTVEQLRENCLVPLDELGLYSFNIKLPQVKLATRMFTKPRQDGEDTFPVLRVLQYPQGIRQHPIAQQWEPADCNLIQLPEEVCLGMLVNQPQRVMFSRHQNARRDLVTSKLTMVDLTPD